MPNPPYWPTTDSGVDTWCLNFTTLLTAAPATYGETAPVALACANAYSTFTAALALAVDPSTRTPVTVAAKNDAYAVLASVIQPVGTRISANETVNPADKVSIGVTVRLTTRTRASVADLPIALSLEQMAMTYTRLRTQNPLTPTSTARPLGARYAEISVRVRNAADTEDEFVAVGSATRRFYNFATADAWHGRRAYFKARWVGAALAGGAANVGAWSEEVSLILP